ncbi:peptidase S8/S53 domain-containing protein [Paraphysoderma sedebokerense]|nr:peptidase S8/S53 domain-containing protein [Paraphysoderma sedebokerense]KAI9141710.1 peptidase S8/S53 domain-containing protein [Paraphysoderma sedebokerense]
MKLYNLFCLIFYCNYLFIIPVSATHEIHKNAIPDNHNSHYYYAVEVPPGTSPQLVAEDLNYELVGQIGELKHHYLYRIPKPEYLVKRSIDRNLNRNIQYQEEEPEQEIHHKRHYKRFLEHPKVVWVERQVPKRRLFKRGVLNERQEGSNDIAVIKDRLAMKDPGFDQQWHLYNYENRGNDVNVTQAWLQGVTGKNVTVAIIDDGLDYESEDLKDNFSAEGSYDFNDKAELPTPKLDDDIHGTRCAGEIAAVKNSVCGVGVAYEAKVSGIRILSAEISEVEEAAAVNYGFQTNHVYSCSWGPQDDGRTTDGPPNLVVKAFMNGINNGRGGLGSIYVLASGNGGVYGDNCNFDGYANAIYTVTIGAIDRLNKRPYYAEMCAPQLAVTYSSGSGGHIYTTDIGPSKCTNQHGGTSAAAPLVAGMVALVLSIRPDLHWRDIQDLIIKSAVPFNIDTPNEDWSLLPTSRHFSHKYGYGRVDASLLVSNSRNHSSLNPHTSFSSPIVNINLPIPSDRALESTFTITQDMVNAEGVKLKKLEHVQVTIDIAHQRRGDLEIWIVSPNNVVSVLATRRNYDTSAMGLRNWTFMSVKHWEENPVGQWTLKVFDQVYADKVGTLKSWKLTLNGESSEPGSPTSSASTSTQLTSSTLATSVIATLTSTLTTSSYPSATTSVTPTSTATTKTPLPGSSTEIATPVPTKRDHTFEAILLLFVFSCIVLGVAFYYRRRQSSNNPIAVPGWIPFLGTPDGNNDGKQGYEFTQLRDLIGRGNSKNVPSEVMSSSLFEDEDSMFEASFLGSESEDEFNVGVQGEEQGLTKQVKPGDDLV